MPFKHDNGIYLNLRKLEYAMELTVYQSGYGSIYKDTWFGSNVLL